MLIKESKSTTYEKILDYENFLSKKQTAFLYPTGIKHFLSYPATLQDVIDFLKSQGLLMESPIPALIRNDIPPIPAYVCVWGKDISSSGTDADPYIAILKSLSEGLERTLMFDREFFLNKIMQDVPKNIKIIDPYANHSFFPHQKRNLELENSETTKKIEYVYFHDVLSKEKVAIRCDYIFWGEEFPGRILSSTNGGGAHTKKDLALLSAIHEQVERDAFLIHWLCKITPKKIRLSSITDKKSQALLRTINDSGLEIHLLALDSGVGVPTFLSCLIDERKEPTVLAIAGAVDSFDHENGVYRALAESITVLGDVLRGIDKAVVAPSDMLPFTSQKIDRHGRVLFWKGAWVKKEIGWMLRGEEVSLDDLKLILPELPRMGNRPEGLVKHMQKSMPAIRVYAMPLESSIASKLGLSVYKVAIPELLSLYLVESDARVNSLRLSKILKKEGDKLLSALNPLPHPYP